MLPSSAGWTRTSYMPWLWSNRPRFQTGWQLAGTGMLCFSSRLSEKFWRELLHAEMDEDLLRARVLLMIAGGEGQYC